MNSLIMAATLTVGAWGHPNYYVQEPVVYSGPVHVQTYGAPVYEQTYAAPARVYYHRPVRTYRVPVYQAPIYQTPIYQAPAYQVPLRSYSRGPLRRCFGGRCN